MTLVKYERVINVRLEPKRNHPEVIRVYAINDQYKHIDFELHFKDGSILISCLALIIKDAKRRMNYLIKKGGSE